MGSCAEGNTDGTPRWIASWIFDMVGRNLAWLGIERRQKGLCERYFTHSVGLYCVEVQGLRKS
jgi:hypothetical protein